jgi:hypothetical protein
VHDALTGAAATLVLALALALALALLAIRPAEKAHAAPAS